GLVRQRDNWRRQARAWKSWLQAKRGRIVTTDLVLWEVLNAASATAGRSLAAELYWECRRDRNCEVVDTSPEQIHEAVDHYTRHTDKGWSLTDCRSFLVMKGRRLQDALAA